jgi:hypothetical protein
LNLFILKAFAFPFYQVWHKDFSENHQEYYSGTIDIILNKNYVSKLSFSGVFNPPGFYRGSACFVLGSAGALPGSTGALPGSTGALPASSGNDRGSTGMNRSFTWALPG